MTVRPSTFSSKRNIQSFLLLLFIFAVTSFSSGMRIDQGKRMVKRSRKNCCFGVEKIEPNKIPTLQSKNSANFGTSDYLNSEWKNQWLSSHNKVRKFYGTSPLIWDETLAKSAQEHAEKCTIAHSPNAFGENIATGQETIDAVVYDWVISQDECMAYDPDHVVGSHFTQLLWETTSRFGCAKQMCPKVHGLSDCKNIFVWVCQYDPAGNYDDQARKNVKATKGQCPPKSMFTLPY
ncbi:hypothetical protein O181_036160 [Austropuccinia psidii MF-1]|uniref:SCP domain-containing protein n=1 Tax=Austropuccinia psidii MF-1 TaxID=1389203 RepID=A0A9Q3D8E2_9BASI|nr:hypothetical protein [Austropuccinia psidii MF-1]